MVIILYWSYSHMTLLQNMWSSLEIMHSIWSKRNLKCTFVIGFLMFPLPSVFSGRCSLVEKRIQIRILIIYCEKSTDYLIRMINKLRRAKVTWSFLLPLYRCRRWFVSVTERRPSLFCLSAVLRSVFSGNVTVGRLPLTRQSDVASLPFPWVLSW